MNLIRFTFANIFDFKSVMDSITNRNKIFNVMTIHSSNSNNLQIVFRYAIYTNSYIEFVNSICTPTNIEDLHE